MQAEPLSTEIYGVFTRLLADAAARGLSLRLSGGLAVLLHCPLQLVPFKRRNAAIHNFDFAAYSYDRKAVNDLLLEYGFRLDRHYSRGKETAVYLSAVHGFRCDISFNALPFHHHIPLGERLLIDYPTLPLAELLLQKLQIPHPSWKHVCDIQSLLAEHDLAEHDDDTINITAVTKLCAAHWGLTTTVVTSIDNAVQYTRCARDIPPAIRDRVIVRLELLRKAIKEQPKQLRWWLRALVGKRIRWYRPLPRPVGTKIAQ